MYIVQLLSWSCYDENNFGDFISLAIYDNFEDAKYYLTNYVINRFDYITTMNNNVFEFEYKEEGLIERIWIQQL